MSKSIAAAASVAVNAAPAKTFAAALALDPVRIVQPKGMIPGVASVAGQSGPWSMEGQTRTMTLTDKGSVEETLIEIEPLGYRYRIGNFTGPFRMLVREARARFYVQPRGEGSLLTWTYEFEPKGAIAATILSFLVDSQWNAFMDATLQRLKDEIERA